MNNMAFLGVLLSASMSINFAHAGTIFLCDTTNHKKILVKDLGSHIQYKFGKNLESPELELLVTRSQASTWQWKGIGREISYSVTIPNGNTNYTVYFSVDRLSEEQAITSGVIVEVNEEELARVYCLSDTLNQALEGIDLKESD